MDAPIHAAPGRSFDSYAEFYRESAYAAFPQEHRAGGSLGLTLMRCDQEPIDLIDARVPDMLFYKVENDGREVLIDLGDGSSRSLQRSGTIGVHPPDVEIYTRVQDPSSITVAAFPMRSLAPLLDEAGVAANAYGSFFGRMSEAPRASRLLSEVWAVTSRGGPSMSLLLDGLALQFLAVMADSVTLSPLGPARREDVRIAHAVDYAEAHLARPLSVGELAEVAALSPSRFARVFRATTGEAVWAYVQRRRLERAEELLRATSLSVAEIAFRVGYADVSRFGLHFRRRTGRTPSACRED